MSSGLIGDVAAHPLESLVAGLEEWLTETESAPAWTLTPHQLTDLLPRLAVLGNQLDAVRLAMLREADRLQVGDASGFANTGAWYATTTRSTKPSAHRAVALARSLDEDAHQAVRRAARAGAVSVDQAAVIVAAVEKLPTDLADPEVKRRAEADLVAFAATHGPKELRFLGSRILEYVAPDVAEEAERRVLEAEERQAAADAYFAMHRDGQGSVIGRFKVPLLAGAILEKHLNALAAPKHQIAIGTPRPEERVARPVRLGAAFVEYLQTRPTRSGMPQAGGIPATVVVTLSAEALTGTSEQAAELDNGERISAALARSTICNGARVMRMILDAESEPLDVGRAKRFHTPAQRIAIGVRDRTCREENCDQPASMCHVHHARRSWAEGGGTNVRDGILLCPRAHAMAHDRRYAMTYLPSGRIRFTRRREQG